MMQRKAQRKYKEYKPFEHPYQRQLKNIEDKIIQERQLHEDYFFKISEINKNIQKEKNALICKCDGEVNFKNEVEKIFNQLISKQRENTLLKRENLEKLAKRRKYIEKKKQQLELLKKQKQNYQKENMTHSAYQQQCHQLQNLKLEIQRLEERIESNDPITYQSQIRVEFYEMKRLLEAKQDAQLKLKQDIELKELEESIQKNKLVVELGKYEQLKREIQQKEQTLKSLNRHSQQIRERVTMMKKQKKLLKKGTATNSFEINKEILDIENENEELIKQIQQGQEKVNNQQAFMAKCIHKNQMEELEKQYAGLQIQLQQTKIKSRESDNNENKVKKNIIGNDVWKSEKMKKKVKKLQLIRSQIQSKEDQLKRYEKENEDMQQQIQQLLKQARNKNRQEKSKINNTTITTTKSQSNTKNDKLKDERNQQNQVQQTNPNKDISKKNGFIVIVAVIHFLVLLLICITF